MDKAKAPTEAQVTNGENTADRTNAATQTVERQLGSVRAIVDWQPIPEAQLDAAIRAGIEAGEAGRRRRLKRTRRLGAAAAAACILLVLFMGALRVSPVFAGAVRSIPGMEAFVALLAQPGADSVWEKAIEAGMAQPLDVSQTQDGVTLHAKAIIADSYRMALLYEVEGPYLGTANRMSDPHVTDSAWQRLLASAQFLTADLQPADGVEHEGNYTRQGVLKFDLTSTAPWPEQVLVVAELEGMRFQLPITIDAKAFAELGEKLDVQQQIVVDGQHIDITGVTLYPLQTVVHLAMPEANSKEIYSIGPVRLHDGNGRSWQLLGTERQSVGEQAAQRLDLKFESYYFEPPGELYLEGEMFIALDKELRQVTIDTEAGVMLVAPDEKLAFESAVDDGNYITVAISLSGLAADDFTKGYTPLGSQFTDATGANYEMEHPDKKLSWLSDSATGKQISYYYLKSQHYVQPLTFEVASAYPAYIREPYTVKLK